MNMYAGLAPRTKEEIMRNHQQVLFGMDTERQYWFSHWRTLSDYFLPRRYPWLMSQNEVRTANRRNNRLLDSTSTLAVRTLASGMMNGITSPARPWFSLRLAGMEEAEIPYDALVWLDNARETLMLVMSESNFYNAFAIMYLEWCTFGTASLGIFEDARSIIRCYNYALGEFYIAQDDTQRIHMHGRRVTYQLHQLVSKFDLENVCETNRAAFLEGGTKLFKPVEICHLIEENKDDGLLAVNSKYREVYWELGTNEGYSKYLAVWPLWEWPTVTPRWELYGNDVYGTSPAMDALSDVEQLQAMILERAKGLEKQISPPMLVDSMLANRPTALHARGVTYANANSEHFGARPAYLLNVPLQEIANDILQLQNRIRETCHNNLFNMISQLETVRSATEIDARREEKLVHLGPVLERFYTEGLDPAIQRIFGICDRQGLFGEKPESLKDATWEVKYVSILSDAQRASDVATIERFFSFTGNLAGVYPEVREVPDVEELVREYAKNLGLSPKALFSKEAVAEKLEEQRQAASLAQTAAIGKDLASGAAALGGAEVSPGANALQTLTGGV